MMRARCGGPVDRSRIRSSTSSPPPLDRTASLLNPASGSPFSKSATCSGPDPCPGPRWSRGIRVRAALSHPAPRRRPQDSACTNSGPIPPSRWKDKPVVPSRSPAVTERTGDIAQRIQTADRDKQVPLYAALGITSWSRSGKPSTAAVNSPLRSGSGGERGCQAAGAAGHGRRVLGSAPYRRCLAASDKYRVPMRPLHRWSSSACAQAVMRGRHADGYGEADTW